MPTLDSLPPELWLACWVLVSRRQLLRLLFVCRLFRSLCLPNLFAHRTVDVGAIIQGIGMANWIDRTHTLHRLVLRLDGIAQPPYGQLVRTCTARFAAALHTHPGPLGEGPDARILRLSQMPCWGTVADYSHIRHIGTFNALRDRAYNKLVESLGVYRNLTKLDMERILIDERVRTILGSLENLEELTLNICDIDPPAGPLLKLRRFTLCENSKEMYAKLPRHFGPTPPADYQVHLIDPAHLVQLRMDPSALTVPMFNGFKGRTFPVLRDVTLWPEFERVVLPFFLENAPSIESLSLPGLAWGPDTVIEPLSTQVLPNLSKLAADAHVVVEFATGRPVCEVSVTHSWDTGLESVKLRDVLVQLSQGSLTAIRSLALAHTRSTTETLAAVTAIFPALSELTLNHPGGRMPRGARERGQVPMMSTMITGASFTGDERVVELDDERVFEGLPEEVVSDSEEAEADSITFFETRYYTFLNEVVDGLVELPAQLQVLRLRPPMRYHYCPVEEYAPLTAVDLRKLQDRFPSLEMVALGSSQICRDHACAGLFTMWRR
ncbi:hypothetical protein FB45DRAFT_1024339 [Roridomyces roridus]|uniref:F-box domain-containing protein n=1 Tax=Roridomyces roridus TaxID=1738132 RepID=A0AAD7FPG0_9AGAR|nr:hypothetical protein FB45DRAFT_1024339 [Roridomyces roridus]